MLLFKYKAKVNPAPRGRAPYQIKQMKRGFRHNNYENWYQTKIYYKLLCAVQNIFAH